MTTPTDTVTTPRKTLAQQIDRLDGILDGLDEALHGAVADAVREAVGPIIRETMQLAIVETLSRPEMIWLALEKQPALSRPVTVPLRKRVPGIAMNGVCPGPLEEVLQSSSEATRDISRASAWAVSKCRRGCELALAGCGCIAAFCFGVRHERAPT